MPATATVYYRVATTLEHEMAGAGLGYDEMYGDGPRYFWDRNDADKRIAELNASLAGDPLQNTYWVDERMVYQDGDFDDKYDASAREQLAL